MVFDHSGQHLYISTSSGQVKSYNLATNQFDATYNVGTSLNGVDIAVDDSFLIIAENATGPSQGTFYRLNLATGAVTNINYTKDTRLGGESGAWDVSIAGNGLALVTTQFPGSGWTPLRQIDLTTNVISIRNDAPGSGPYNMVGQNTQICRSADRSILYLLESNISSGPIFTYSSATNSFSPSAQTGYFLGNSGAAANRNGSLLGTQIGSNSSMDTVSGFGYVHSFNFLDSGVAFDAQTDTFYGVDSSTSQIRAFDTNTFVEKFRMDIGETLSAGGSRFGSGNLVASQDGRYVALGTPSGVRIYTIPNNPPRPPPSAFGTPNDMVFDHAGTHLYITTAEGLVWPYDLVTDSFDTPYDLGGSLAGLDIADDDSYLLVAQYDTGLTQGAFQRLNLSTGMLSNIGYSRTFGEGGAWDVAIGSNGLALVTTEYQGSGWTPLRQINLTTNVITNRTDDPGSGGNGRVRQETQIHRSADRTRMYFLESNISSGPVFTYSATNDSFGLSVQTDAFLDVASAAVNRDGSLLGTRLYNTPASLDTAPNFDHVHSFGTIDSGVAFDATRDVFYGIDSVTDQIIAYDTNTYIEKFRFDIGENVSSGSSQFGPGYLVASQDGHYLALQTSTAIRIYRVPAVQLVSVASVTNHGSAGSFSIDLPLDPPRGVECRSGGPNGQYTIVFTFGLGLTNVGGASITSGIGTVTSSMIDSSDSHRYFVNLSGITNAQYIKVTLSNVNDSAGNHTNLISQQMGILIGDVNGTGRVDAADVSFVRQQTLQPIDASNFRADINGSGRIDAADVSVARQQTLTSLPASP
jgi:hypothetical protein